MGIISGVIDSTLVAARDAGADKVTAVNLRVGEMTEAIEDALQFAMAAGTAAVMRAGTSLSRVEDINRIRHDVRVEELKMAL